MRAVCLRKSLGFELGLAGLGPRTGKRRLQRDLLLQDLRQYTIKTRNERTDSPLDPIRLRHWAHESARTSHAQRRPRFCCVFQGIREQFHVDVAPYRYRIRLPTRGHPPARPPLRPLYHHSTHGVHRLRQNRPGWAREGSTRRRSRQWEVEVTTGLEDESGNVRRRQAASVAGETGVRSLRLHQNSQTLSPTWAVRPTRRTSSACATCGTPPAPGPPLPAAPAPAHLSPARPPYFSEAPCPSSFPFLSVHCCARRWS